MAKTEPLYVPNWNTRAARQYWPPMLSVIWPVFAPGFPRAFQRGMNLWLVFLGAQILVTALAVVRERKNNTPFEGDKLSYRS